MKIYAVYRWDDFIGFKQNPIEAYKYVRHKLMGEKNYSDIKELDEIYENYTIKNEYRNFYGDEWEIIVVGELK